MVTERKVQEAKLEDLLRRGTSADLKAANELMKVMSGYVFILIVSVVSKLSRRLKPIITLIMP